MQTKTAIYDVFAEQNYPQDPTTFREEKFSSFHIFLCFCSDISRIIISFKTI